MPSTTATSTLSPSARLAKDLARYERSLTAADKQLNNESFMSKAPAHIVEGLRKQSTETRILYDRTKAALEALPPN
jgi:valyl-tRNA synthetase